MEERIVIAGFGGQGVMAIGQLLTYAGMIEDKNVSWLPSYGPEMRGGTANCSVIISDEPVGSPVVIDSTSAIVMNKPSLDKFEQSIDKNGKPIPGLYVAGSDAGGMYGKSYVDFEGGTLGFAYTSGRLAGKNAVKYIGK